MQTIPLLSENSSFPSNVDNNVIKTDYKVPLNPISENKNVIASAPILNNPNIVNPGLNGIINPQNNTYYNTYINPYAYNTPGFSYLNMVKPPLIPTQRNYGINILPNSFQGKIPLNQYGPPYQHNIYASYPSISFFH